MVGKIRQVAYAVLTAALVGCSSTGTSPQSTTTLVTPAVTPGITPTLSVAATRASETAPATPGVFDASQPQGTGKPEGAGTPQGASKPQGAGKPEGAGKPSGVAPEAAKCPTAYPIKGDRADRGKPERTYYLPGTPTYEAAQVDECFATEADAQAAGYRRSER